MNEQTKDKMIANALKKLQAQLGLITIDYLKFPAEQETSDHKAYLSGQMTALNMAIAIITNETGIELESL